MKGKVFRSARYISLLLIVPGVLLAGCDPAAPVVTPTAESSIVQNTPTAVAQDVATPTEVGGVERVANPFSGAKLYIDPSSRARQQVNEWRTTRPADADQIEKIAGQPHADWFGEWSGDIKSAVETRVKMVNSAGAFPVLVAYNIPGRDCGSYSKGGAESAERYETWIRDFAAGIGSGKAAVILEPDALPGMDCLDQQGKDSRVKLLKDAVSVLKANPGTAVYIDAGHSHWKSAEEIASRLKDAGIAQADGFSLNVSNFIATPDLIAYGKEVSSLAGGKHFVIDTSRNGLGATPDFQWCNPAGRALGHAPTVDTGEPLVDAFVWVKVPGESDGECNGGPSAGTWWPEYALGLAQRAP